MYHSSSSSRHGSGSWLRVVTLTLLACVTSACVPSLAVAQQQPQFQQQNFQPNMQQPGGPAPNLQLQAQTQNLQPPNLQQPVVNPANWSQLQPGVVNQTPQPGAGQLNGPAGFVPGGQRNMGNVQPNPTQPNPTQPTPSPAFSNQRYASPPTAAQTPASASQPLAEANPVPATSAPADSIDFSDPEATSKELGKQAQDTVHDMKNKFWAAVDGDKQAQIDLAMQYVLPVFVIIGVLLAASWLARRAQSFVTQVVSKQVDQTLGEFAGRMTRFGIVAIAVMGVLGYFGVETASVAAVVAALGFAIGMALQGTLGNFAAGIALLVFRPFNVGDYIVVAGEEGIVRAISLFTTSIDTLDNRHIIMPNDSVFGNTIENWSHHAERRVDVLVGVSYSADMKQTRQVLLNAMSDIQGAMPGRGPQVYLNELNASSVDWYCRVWCHPSEYLDVKERVTEAAKTALDANGIGIPFPQLDLHVVSPAMKQKLAA